MQDLIADCHVHWGPDSEIKKENYDLRADVNFVTATNENTKEVNMRILKAQGERIKCFWWYNGTRIPENVFGVKYHGTYLNKPIDPYDDNLKHFKRFLIHTGMFLDGDPKSNTSYIHAVKFAELNPQSKVILAHMGGSINKVIKKAIELGKRYDNVYLDTSGITNPLIIEYAVKNFRDDHIMFGSDIPWCSFDSMLYNVLDADITQKQKQMILYDNLMEFVK